ncbi:MAG TPA: hypothetical protein VK875_00740 [Euzebyales bacterium]|nr:hypothetical protein [Euzebyales bacterium]
MARADDLDYRFSLCVASLVMAEQLAETEPDEQRRTRKQTVAQEKWSLLRDTFPTQLGELHGYGGTGPALRQLTQVFEEVTRPWPPDQRWALLVDLIMSNVFAPYELKVPSDELCEALRTVSDCLELGDDHDHLVATWEDALRAYRPPRWKAVIAPATTGAVAPTSGPDPATAAALATAARLEGPAAGAHGVALLAGGSLGFGGTDLASGRWIMTVPSDADAILPGGGLGLLALGPAHARVELLKLQLSCRLVLQHGWSSATPDDVVDALVRVSADLHAQLDIERRVNDDDAQRLKDIKAVLDDVAAAHTAVAGAQAQAA